MRLYFSAAGIDCSGPPGSSVERHGQSRKVTSPPTKDTHPVGVSHSLMTSSAGHSSGGSPSAQELPRCENIIAGELLCTPARKADELQGCLAFDPMVERCKDSSEGGGESDGSDCNGSELSNVPGEEVRTLC
jgi:hypothetical protein